MKPLRLVLDPVLPWRTPTAGDCFEYGFHLRLPRGPALERTDPLLTAYGASVEWLEVGEDHEEALQTEAFEPGRRVELLPEPFEPERPDAIGVWDAERLRQAGALRQAAGEVVTAAAESGLEQAGLVLWDHRSAVDDRRERLGLLVHSPDLIRVAKRADARIVRPARPSRPRLVLVADGSGEVRWWDPSATRGPLEAGDVELSTELRAELEQLRDTFTAHAANEPPGLEREWQRHALNLRAAELWERARSELGRRYTVGFLGAGMRRPVWSPAELIDDGDDDEYGLEVQY